MLTRRNARPMLRLVLLPIVAAVSLAACSDRSKSPPPTMTTAELLRAAADSFATMRTLFFTLNAHPVVPGVRFAAVGSGDGTVVWPDRLVFRGTMQSTPTLAAPVVIVMCGPDRFLELGDGNFMKMEALPDVHRLLFAPTTGLVPGALAGLEQPSAPEAAQAGDVAAWRVTGAIADQLLAALPGRTAPGAAPVRAELWIGQVDLRLHKAILTGPMFDGDSVGAVRTFTFSRFNEPLPLTVPRGQLPCAAEPAK